MGTEVLDLAAETRVRSAEAAVGCPLGSGIAILDMRTNTYFSLNAVGAFVWAQMLQPIAVSDLCDRVEATFAVDRARCESDVRGLLADLVAHRLAEVA